jgi:hypothetical protein
MVLCPERAQQINPGQRPGLGWRRINQALKGRNNLIVLARLFIVAPFQGSARFLLPHFPGRCPGLICCAPFGAENTAS